MGATQSLLSDKGNTSSVKKGVFDKDLVKLNNIVSSIITNDNKFKDSSYNFLNSKTCDRYTMVMENNLHKHLKIHLHDVAQNIFFIPKSNDQVKLNDNSTITKKDVLGSGAFGRCTNLLIVSRKNPASVSGSFSYRCIRPALTATNSASSACGTAGSRRFAFTVFTNASTARGIKYNASSARRDFFSTNSALAATTPAT